MKIGKVKAIEYHRNGVSGEPFHVVLFKHKKRDFIGILFDQVQEGTCCAVLDVQEAANGNIKFGSNSWRGDQFAPELHQAIAKKEEKA